MKEQLATIRSEALAAFAQAGSSAELDALRVKYLGKKGELTAVLKQMGKLSAEERPAMGQLANEVRAALEAELEAKGRELEAKALEARLEAEALDVTVPGKPVTMGHRHPLNTVVEQLYGKGTKTRFRPHHFPFTEPSCEMDVQCHKCGGVGCPTCKGEGWIELLGAGMIHPRVLEMAGIDPSVYSGWAFGIGLERTAMRRFKIADLRLIFENDVRFLEQF